MRLMILSSFSATIYVYVWWEIYLEKIIFFLLTQVMDVMNIPAYTIVWIVYNIKLNLRIWSNSA